jgi:hypothetical protein
MFNRNTHHWMTRGNKNVTLFLPAIDDPPLAAFGWGGGGGGGGAQ